MTVSEVRDNPEQNRFELEESGETAFANYRLDGNHMTIPYVESPVALSGKGTAGRLMEGVVQQAKVRGLKITPICGYAVHWFKRHPEHNSVLA